MAISGRILRLIFILQDCKVKTLDCPVFDQATCFLELAIKVCFDLILGPIVVQMVKHSRFKKM